MILVVAPAKDTQAPPRLSVAGGLGGVSVVSGGLGGSRWVSGGHGGLGGSRGSRGVSVDSYYCYRETVEHQTHAAN